MLYCLMHQTPSSSGVFVYNIHSVIDHMLLNAPSHKYSSCVVFFFFIYLQCHWSCCLMPQPTRSSYVCICTVPHFSGSFTYTVSLIICSLIYKYNYNRATTSYFFIYAVSCTDHAAYMPQPQPAPISLYTQFNAPFVRFLYVHSVTDHMLLNAPTTSSLFVCLFVSLLNV